MNARPIETYWDNGTWNNRRQGDTQPRATYETREYARAVARQVAMDDRTEHIVKNVDGHITERTIYSEPTQRRRR